MIKTINGILNIFHTLISVNIILPGYNRKFNIIMYLVKLAR